MADDGISWLFELDGDTSGAEKMLNVLGSLDSTVKKLDSSLNILKQGSQAAGAAHKKHGEEVRGLSGFVKHLTDTAMGPLINRMKQVGEMALLWRGMEKLIDLPGEIISKVKELGAEMLNVAAQTEEMAITFKALFGAADGARLLDYSDELSAKTGILDDQWKSIEMTLGNAGFKIGPDMERAVRAVADLGALSGQGAAGAQEAAQMFARLQNLGEISPRMLTRFGLNVKSFWTELGHQTGKGVETLKKEMNEGKVDIEYTKAAIEQLIVAKTHKGLGGLGADIGEDTMSRIRRLKDLPDQFMQQLTDTSGFKAIGDTLGRAFDALNPKGVAGKQIYEGLASAFSKVGNAIAAVDWPEVGSEIGGAINFVGSAFAMGIEFVDQFARGLSRLYGIFTGVPGAFTDAFTSFNTVLNTVGGKIVDGFVSLGSSIWHGLTDGITGGVTHVLEAVGGLGDAMVGKLKGVLGIHSPSLVFKQMGIMTTRGYAQGVEEETPRAESAVATVMGAPAAAGARAGMHVGSVSLTVQLQGTGYASADAEMLGERLKSILPTALISAFDQFATEGGS